MITKERAYAIASSWGSYMHNTDPGACFYSFKLNDGRPITEKHRTECLRYAATIKPSTKVGMREIAELMHFHANCDLA